MRPATETRTETIRVVAGLVAVVGLTLWAYWGVLSAPFHFDDSLFLESPQVSDPGDVGHILRPAQTRQFTYLTFYWNYRLGGANPKGYHLFSLMLHLANVLLIYLFTRLLFDQQTDWPDIAIRRLLPIAASGIFALHPIQSEPVNYAYQRSTLLAAFFSLLALSVYLWSKRLPNRKMYPIPAVLFWLLAGASKESAWILPIVLVAYLWANARDSRSFCNSLWQERYFMAAGLTVMLCGGAWAYYSVRHGGDRTIGSNLFSGWGLYLISQVQVLATYLRLLIWPVGLSVDHDFKVAPLWSLYGLECMLLLLGLLALIVRIRRPKPTLAFLGVTFFIFLAPTSSTVPSADLLFEHRLYLPMIGASPLLAFGILSLGCALVHSGRRFKAVCLGVLTILLVSYTLLTRHRTFVWQDNVRLWTDAVAKAPGKARAHYNLGVAYLKLDVEKARQEFLFVTRISPAYAPALYNLGWIDQVHGRYATSREYYLASLKADGGNWRAHQNLANLDVLQGRLRDATMEYRETIRLSPDYWPAYLSLAALQIRQGNPADALPTLQKLKELRPDLLESRYLTAYALVECGRPSEAEAELRRIEASDIARSYRSRIEELRLRIETESKRP